MNFRNLPTDNLYKFLAIAGLLIAFGAPTLIQNRVDQLEKILAEQNVALLVVKKELTILDSKRKSRIPDEQLQLYAHKTDPTIRLPMGNAEINELLTPSEWHSVYSSAEKQLQENTNKTATKKQMEDCISIIVFLFGLCLSSFGFYRWYYKIQRHMDTIWELRSKQTTQ